MKSRYNLVCLVLTLIPLAFLIYFMVACAVEVPYWDQWEFISLLDKSYRGTLSFSDLWAQHGEHRPFFPVVIMILLAHVSNWNTFYELVVNVLLGIGIFWVILYQLRKNCQVIRVALSLLANPDNISNRIFIVPISKLVVGGGRFKYFSMFWL